MVERSASKKKVDVALQTQSFKDEKERGMWNGNKGRDGYNNSNGINYQEEDNSSNKKQCSN